MPGNICNRKIAATLRISPFLNSTLRILGGKTLVKTSAFVMHMAVKNAPMTAPILLGDREPLIALTNP